MEDAGLDTFSCVTDDIAIELASSNPAFDAVLGDGIDVDIVNRVRGLADPDRAGTPIVILASYHATDEDAGAAMAAGAAAYLTRPVVGKELVDAVRAALTSDDGPGG